MADINPLKIDTGSAKKVKNSQYEGDTIDNSIEGRDLNAEFPAPAKQKGKSSRGANRVGANSITTA